MKYTIFFILVLAFAFRIYGMHWDQGGHFHPDERALIMISDRINFPTQVNPDFFNYGSLPLYILKGSAQLADTIFKTSFANYDGLLYFGRSISVIIELLIIFIIYKISLNLWGKKKIAYFVAFFYTIAFFPIQNSHFFIVDNFLNLFATLLIYLLISYCEKPSNRLVFGIAVTTAAAIATKFTAVIFLPFAIGVFFFSKSFINALIFSLLTLIFTFLFMPYAFLSYSRFFTDILAQTKMNSDPYIFPYTLQYVGSLPYLYYLKNVFLWGLGPVLSLLSLLGLSFLLNKNDSKNELHSSRFTLHVFLLFYLFYFLVIGRSAVKFMRYMLLMYPLFAILAGYGLYKLKSSRILHYSILVVSLIWTSFFINIYSQKSTRIAATDWIIKNIPAGSTLATEHWDDRLPTIDNGYRYEEMTLYNLPDDDLKWSGLNEKVNRTDYIIIASNRLYVPLQHLKDCGKFKSCYPKTADYYQRLFNGNLGFKKIAEFTAYPQLVIGNWKLEINDSSADESFTVYDHPKVMIFKKS